MEGLPMTKMLYTFLILLFFVSCEQYERQTASVKIQEQEEKTKAESKPLSDVPAQALSWSADIYMANFSPVQEEKVKNAVAIIKKILGSQEFKDRVLNYTYNGSKKFFDNQGMTNEEVYQKILDGAEKMGNSNKNNAMDVELELYHQTTSTIGYTYPNTVRIWMNTKYFNRYTPIKVADNLMHEWMHKLGFTHATIWSKDRDHSVPYAIGYLLEELAGKLPK
jgi:hypothetical protein